MTSSQPALTLEMESLPQGGHARETVWRGVVAAWMTHAPDCGAKSCACWLNFAPPGSSARTSLAFCKSTADGISAPVVGDLAQLRMGVCWRVLDAQHFGVPQRRARVFVVGHFGNDEYGPVEVLLEPESSSGDSAPFGPSGADVAEVASVGVGGGSGGGVVAPLLAHQGRNDPATETFVSVTGDRTHALTAEGHDASEDGTGRDAPIVGCGTVVRRLTPLEKERLQGFPDGWTSHSAGKIQSDSARAKQLGNSVAVPVIEWIGRRLVKVHENAAHPVTHAH